MLGALHLQAMCTVFCLPKYDVMSRDQNNNNVATSPIFSRISFLRFAVQCICTVFGPIFFFSFRTILALAFLLYAIQILPHIAEMHISRHVFHFSCMQLLSPANCILLNFTDIFLFLILDCHAAVKVHKHFSRMCFPAVLVVGPLSTNNYYILCSLLFYTKNLSCLSV